MHVQPSMALTRSDSAFRQLGGLQTNHPPQRVMVYISISNFGRMRLLPRHHEPHLGGTEGQAHDQPRHQEDQSKDAHTRVRSLNKALFYMIMV